MYHRIHQDYILQLKFECSQVFHLEADDQCKTHQLFQLILNSLIHFFHYLKLSHLYLHYIKKVPETLRLQTGTGCSQYITSNIYIF